MQCVKLTRKETKCTKKGVIKQQQDKEINTHHTSNQYAISTM